MYANFICCLRQRQAIIKENQRSRSFAFAFAFAFAPILSAQDNALQFTAIVRGKLQ